MLMWWFKDTFVVALVIQTCSRDLNILPWLKHALVVKTCRLVWATVSICRATSSDFCCALDRESVFLWQTFMLQNFYVADFMWQTFYVADFYVADFCCALARESAFMWQTLHARTCLHTMYALTCLYTMHALTCLYTMHALTCLYTMHALTCLYTMHINNGLMFGNSCIAAASCSLIIR